MRKHFNKPLKMTAEDERDFRQSTSCHTCGRKLKMKELEELEELEEDPENILVRDHCHITGKYRGSVHKYCNLKLSISPEWIKIPVIFHNLKGYDSHFIMQKIGKMIEDDRVFDIIRVKIDPKKGTTLENMIEVKTKIDVKVIANNFEKYMALRLGRHLSFIDSFQFMSQSLDKLSSNLPEDRFIYTKEGIDGDLEFSVMKKKGVYPYDYMNSFSRFNETSLPKREDFYSLLNDEDISEEQYKHAQKVWDAFRFKNVGEYHDLYLKSEILLLADVFENLRKTCLIHYRLDPSHYMTSPGLSCDAMLKMTWMDLISDIDMQLFIEKGLRGGISYISHRHGKANNKYMKDYDKNKESSFLMYLDANNLYGWAMSQSLPFGDFKWKEFSFLGKDLPGLDEKGLRKLGIDLNPKEKIMNGFHTLLGAKKYQEKE